MVHRTSGKVIHIDFGDCFEVAMTRSKWPEKVPFRLTRMLVNAMEASGIEGTFRRTCEAVMELLRENASSVLAMLEVFVHDPLIKWRLLDPGWKEDPNRLTGRAAARAARRAQTGAEPALHSDSDSDDDYEEVGDDDEGAAGSFGANNTRWRVRARLELEAQALVAGKVDPEKLNARAVRVISRVSNKLTGKEFDPTEPVTVAEQVHRLIEQATATENLSCMYVGWCPFW